MCQQNDNTYLPSYKKPSIVSRTIGINNSAFDYFSTFELNDLMNILDKQPSMEEFCINCSLYGWDDDKKNKVFNAIIQTVKNEIMNIKTRRDFIHYCEITS